MIWRNKVPKALRFDPTLASLPERDQWIRLGERYRFDDGTRVLLAPMLRPGPHGPRCDCVDCAGRIRP